MSIGSGSAYSSRKNRRARRRLMCVEDASGDVHARCRPSRPSSPVAHLQQAVVHPVAGERLVRAGSRTGPVRSRGAGTAGRARRRGCRASRRGTCMPCAEHSMCQPGPARGPTGTFTTSFGSPGLAPFHRAKSPGFRFFALTSMPRPGLHLLRVAVAQLAVVRVLRDVEVDVAAGRVGEALLDQPLDDLRSSRRCARWPWGM